ncbi:phosphoribosylaminoimidazole carboxylase [Lacticaseibacillus parakribbianus]|uniref:phosphoribosylaminoimidazole carboxylase n=1 Tax=Lacticaseibacillus parakribbianus TaxID=2970927 RepID=UPI0021CB3FAE|nr:phosphoribosylaminoimidazole carboxylase [Lacticaseibacillus parakribbianus]
MSTVDLIVRAYTDLDRHSVIEVIFASADHDQAAAKLAELRQGSPAHIHYMSYTVPLDTDLTALATYPVFETAPNNMP